MQTKKNLGPAMSCRGGSATRTAASMSAATLTPSWTTALTAARLAASRLLGPADEALEDVASEAAWKALAAGGSPTVLRRRAWVIGKRATVDELRRRHGRSPIGPRRRVDPLVTAHRALLDAIATASPDPTDVDSVDLDRMEAAVRRAADLLPRAQRAAVLDRLAGRRLSPAGRRALVDAIPRIRHLIA
jgi:DNA-directed RNA polymerase specialized sigma24 family protein